MEAQAEGAWCSSQKRHQSTEELNQYERSNDIFSQHIQPDSNASEDATVKSDIDTAHPNGLMTDDIQQSSATVASGSSNDKTNNSTSKEYSTWTIRDGEQTMSVPSPTNNPFTDDHESPVAIVEPTNSAAVSVDVDGGSPNPDTTFIEDADHKQEDDREDDHEVEPEDDQYNHYDAYQDEGPTTGEWREPYDESEQPYKSKTVEYSKCTWCRCMARRVVLVSGNEHDSCNCNCHEDMRMRDFDVNQNTVKRLAPFYKTRQFSRHLADHYGETKKSIKKLFERKTVVNVTTVPGVAKMLEVLIKLPTDTPNIGIDLEGVDLGRTGRLCLIQITDDSKDMTYLVDVVILGAEASTNTTTPKRGSTVTLKTILESAAIPKLIWDCRSDTANLFHEYGVKLAGIKDVQLMHTRRKTGENLSYRSGLDPAIRDAGFGPGGWGKWQTNKHAGRSACQDPRGYGVFADRPLSTVLIEYAAGDSRYLIQL